MDSDIDKKDKAIYTNHFEEYLSRDYYNSKECYNANLLVEDEIKRKKLNDASAQE